MYISGIQVPKLGSIQDRTFRAYMMKKVGREIAQAKLLAHVASGIGGNDKSWVRNIQSIWKEFLRASYHLEAEHENLETNMLQEYKKFSNIRPKLVINKDGTLQVKGIPKSAL